METRKPTVLVIEDDKRLLRALSYFLRQKGLLVEEASDGESGVEKYKQVRPDIMVVDNSLPNKMGYEVCRTVREAGGENIPIIMISAFMKVLGADGEQTDADQLVDRFLRKPFQLDQLWRAITNLQVRGRFVRPPSKAGAEQVVVPEPSPDQGGVASEGTCQNTPFIALLAQGLASEATGILTLREDNRVRRLYLANGFPAFARSNLITENLLRYLLRTGEIEAETYRRHLSRMQQERWRPGATLVREGAISLMRLNQAHRMLVEEIIELCINWARASFEFKSSRVPVEQAVVYDINPFRLVDRWLERQFSDIQLLDRTKHFVHGQIVPTAHFDGWRHLLDWAFSLDGDFEHQIAQGSSVVDLIDIPTERRALRTRLLQTCLLMGAVEIKDPDGKMSRSPETIVRALMRPVPRPDPDASNPSGLDRSGAPLGASPAAMEVPAPKKRNPVVVQPPKRPGNVSGEADDGNRSEEQLRRIYDVVLRDYRRVLEESSPYEVLRVSRNDSLDVIRRRYERFERFYRPENFQRLGDSKLYQLAIEIRQSLARAMAEIEAGISSLGISGVRSAVSVSRGASWADPLAAADALAQIFFNDGLTFLRISDLKEADYHFTRAVERESSNATYQAYVIWTGFLAADRAASAAELAREALLRLLERFPEEDTAYHFLAHIHREEGDLEQAIEYYRKAAEINPDNRSARVFLQRLASSPE